MSGSVAEWRDVFTDCAGIALGCTLALLLRHSSAEPRL